MSGDDMVSFALLDDGFYDHPKFLWMTEHHPEDFPAAVGLWAMLVGWAKDRVDLDRLDEAGRIPAFLPVRLVGEPGRRLAGLLAEARLLDETDGGGWYLHNFHVRQELHQWKARRDSGRASAAKRWGSKGGKAPGQMDTLWEPSTVPTGVPNGHPTGDPVTKAVQGSSVQEKTHTPNADASGAAFDAFWELVPRKVGKGQARRAFTTACKRAKPQVIINGMRRFAADPNLPADPQYIPYPATWLNGERWADPPLPSRGDRERGGCDDSSERGAW